MRDAALGHNRLGFRQDIQRPDIETAAMQLQGMTSSGSPHIQYLSPAEIERAGFESGKLCVIKKYFCTYRLFKAVIAHDGERGVLLP